MVRVNPLSQSFNAGELSPWLAARTGFSKYPAGLDTCLNLVPLVEGGLMRRPGSRHVAEVKDSAAKGRLKRFEFSADQAYQIEMGDAFFRFYRHQAQLSVANTDGAISNGTFASNITGWDDRSSGGAGNAISHDSTNGRLTLETSGTAADDIGWAEQDVVISSGFQSVEHVLRFRVIGAAGDRIELRIGTTSTGSEVVVDVLFEVGYHCYAFTPGATTFYVQFRNRGSFRDKDVQIDDVSLIDNAAVEIATPYATADLFEIDGPQSADVLYLFHDSYPTYKLSRLGNASWSLTLVAWEDGPYLDTNTTATTLTPSATTGLGITVTASAIAGINGGLGFQTTDVGRLVRIDNPSSGINWGYAIIVSRTSTTVVVADVRRAFGATTADANWRLGAWSGTTGYARAAAIYEDRLVGGGNDDDPQTMHFSQSAADFENFSPDSADATSGAWDGEVQDNDAFSRTISADDVNTIQWFASQRRLTVGTSGGEWIVSSTGEVLTPTDVGIRRHTKFGCARIKPVQVGNRLLFVQKAKRKVIEHVYSFDADSYVGFDMTRLSRHITFGGIVEMAYAQEQNRVVWAVRNDGVLLGMTYNRDEDIIGWFRSVMGGSFGSGDPVVESVSVIPGTNGAGQVQDSTDRDEVWLIVKRTINGATKRYIEVLERDFEDGHAQEDAYYADSVITYDGASTTSITGVDHLEGETVSIWADGAVQPTKTVVSGAITLDTAASVVQIGLPYTHRMKGLKLDVGGVAGTAVGKKKQIHALTFVVLNSHTMQYGPDTATLIATDFREVSDDMDEAAPLFTGEHNVDFDGDWDQDARIVVESSDPAPFTLLALAPEMFVNDLK